MARMHYGETKAQREADWMARFADAVAALEPRHSGRIEWPSAKHFYYEGKQPQEAAAQYVDNRKEG